MYSKSVRKNQTIRTAPLWGARVLENSRSFHSVMLRAINRCPRSNSPTSISNEYLTEPGSSGSAVRTLFTLSMIALRPSCAHPLSAALSAEPLDLDDEHEVIRWVDQERDESFVMLAEMQRAQ